MYTAEQILKMLSFQDFTDWYEKGNFDKKMLDNRK